MALLDQIKYQFTEPEVVHIKANITSMFLVYALFLITRKWILCALNDSGILRESNRLDR